MTTQVLVAAADDTRDDVVEALGHLNRTAMQLTRCGYTSTRTGRYADLHSTINDLLDILEAKA